MSISKKRALTAGVMMATAMAVTFTACKKDDNNDGPAPRTESYALKGVGADAAATNATVTLTENRDSSINLSIKLNKSTKDAKQYIYVIGGTPAQPGTDTLAAISGDNIKGTGAAMSVNIFQNVKTIKVTTPAGQKDTAFRYADVLKYAAHLKVLTGDKKDTLAIGTVGKKN